MNFQDLKKIEEQKFYLEQAFKNSKTSGRVTFLRSNGDKIARIRTTEYEKIKSFEHTLKSYMQNIIKNFPSIDSMPEFYQELIMNTLDYNALKKSLGTISWAADNISKIAEEYKYQMRTSRDIIQIKKVMNSFYGRISSIMRQINPALKMLEHARQVMKTYPSVKTDLFTIAITGFPNIGKSTLLSKITPAKPEIKDYAFTTKGINQGYARYGINKIQFIDTPGVLDRQKKNAIEEQAYLVLKYATNLIIYVIDLTEPYPLKEQEKLFKGLKDYDKPMIVYLSKTDILPKALIDKYKRKYKACTSITELDKKIEKNLKEFNSSI